MLDRNVGFGRDGWVGWSEVIWWRCFFGCIKMYFMFVVKNERVVRYCCIGLYLFFFIIRRIVISVVRGNLVGGFWCSDCLLNGLVVRIWSFGCKICWCEYCFLYGNDVRSWIIIVCFIVLWFWNVWKIGSFRLIWLNVVWLENYFKFFFVRLE